MNSKITCFISAPANTDTKNIRDILEGLGVIAFDAYDFSIGTPIQKELKRKIQQADFAIAVISERNLNVFYEMGICEGLGKPLFVIMDEDFELPYYLQGHLYLRTSLKNRHMLEISIPKIVDELVTKKDYLKRRKKRTTPSHLKRNSLMEYISKIQALRESGTGVEFEKLAEKVFDELDLRSVVNEFGTRDRGVDFAIWSNNLSLSIGNPILVELKYGKLSQHRICQSERQLQEYIEKAGANVGLLIYLDRSGRRFGEDYSLAPMILRFDFEDFVRGASEIGFENLVLDKRNRLVHGVHG